MGSNRRSIVLVAAVAACAIIHDSRLVAQRPQRALAITDVTVIDVANGTRIPAQTVLIDAGRITRVGPAASTRVPADAPRIDGRGKFLIPGMWDMHVHLFGNIGHIGTDSHTSSFPLFIANGVTGVRDMWTDLEDLKVVEHWRRESAADRLLMPLVEPTSTPVDGPQATVRMTSSKFTSPELARRFVDSLVAGGAKTIKVLDPPRDVYFAVLDETKKLGVPMVGHVNAWTHTREASDGGQKSVEHLSGIDEACTSVEPFLDSLHAAPARAGAKRQQAIIDNFDAANCDHLIAALIHNHTWQVPTEALRSREQHPDDPARMFDPHFRYASPEDTASWGVLTRREASDPARLRLLHGMDDRHMAILGRMYRAGVPMLIGTDLGNPYMVAGFSVHDELAITQQAGATPAQVLRAATLSPAEYLGGADTLGTVATGKRADLVLLDADPLLDIGNARKIRGVFVGGRFLDRAALDALLATAAGLATHAWTKPEVRD
jgi:hypothetical protein